MAEYNEILTQAETDFNANAQYNGSNIAEKDRDNNITGSLETSIGHNIIRNYGGNDELVVETVDLTQNMERYLTIIGSTKPAM
ncbi:MAG: hypothetical protein QNJ65_15335 [Xenococcaceae cyanobacterium MO_234.B1]|nr:hypothetical protein [Xenococcaceae cyanobacterium MO_234.B1]